MPETGGSGAVRAHLDRIERNHQAQNIAEKV